MLQNFTYNKKNGCVKSDRVHRHPYRSTYDKVTSVLDGSYAVDTSVFLRLRQEPVVSAIRSTGTTTASSINLLSEHTQPSSFTERICGERICIVTRIGIDMNLWSAENSQDITLG